MAKQLVVLLLELDSDLLKECGLTDKQFEELPQSLAKAVKKMAPKAIEPTAVFLLSLKEKDRIEKVLTEHALDFTEVVMSYGKPKEAKPQTCTVLHLDSYRRKKHQRSAKG